MTNFDRRAFLRGAALLTGGLALPPSLTRLAAAPAAMPNITRMARGVVFHDRNGNGRRDAGEEGLSGVRVSNGREVVRTDARGLYELPVDDDTILFVIKPRDMMTPVDERQLPRFYYIHNPSGSPRQKFSGVAPTGPLPESVDFGLRPRRESDRFRVLLFGDPQPRNQEEIDFTARDIIEELIGVEAAFGVSLGDIAFDDLSVYTNLNRAIAQLGVPWYNVKGNHDLNFDTPNNRHAAETYKSTFGPTYYSYDYGAVHFVVLDDVVYNGPGQGYHGELGARQLEFVKNDLALVPRDQLVVLMTHIPLLAEPGNFNRNGQSVFDRRELYRLIENRPHTLSLSAHTHFQEHYMIGRADGWNGAQPHHHLVHATPCGSWWSGAPDERGIPHTTMRDGAPNGYSFINFDGHDYTIDFKAARHPAEHQINLFTPDAVSRAEAATTPVLANVFAGSAKSTVEMRLGAAGAWTKMELKPQPDPYYQALKAMEEKNGNLPGRKLPEIINSPHIWQGALPSNPPGGTHLIHVRATDMWGRTITAQRLIRVV